MIYTQSCKSAFEPGVSVVQGEAQSISFPRKGQRNIQAKLNPSIVVEVLFKGTKTYDLGDRLPCYKTIPSLQQII